MTGYNDESYTDSDERPDWDSVGLPVPVGKFDLEVQKADCALDRKHRNIVEMRFKVLSAVDPNDTTSAGRILFETYNFTMEGGFRTKQFAEAAGIPLPVTVNRNVLEDWAANAVGVRVRVTTSHREYRGRVRADIAEYFPYDDTPVLSLVDSQHITASKGPSTTGSAYTAHDAETDAPINPKWAGGQLILRAAGQQDRVFEINDFFRKLVSVGEQLRLIEKKFEKSSISDVEKLSMRQYVARCGGSLASFNKLFANRADEFVGTRK